MAILYEILNLPFAVLSFIWRVLSSLFPWKGSRITLNQAPLVLLDRGGGRQPKFFEGSYLMAQSKARETNKFLLLYLHSSIHVDTPKFCREVLCTEVVASFLEDNFVLWGGDVTSHSAFTLIQDYQVTTFPFFAVLTYVTNSSAMIGYLESLNYTKRFKRSGLTMLYKRQGYVTVPELITALSEVLEVHQALLFAAKSEREDRERDRLLVEQQNREFQEAERLDNQKERERQLQLSKEIQNEQAKKREIIEQEEKARREEEMRMGREKRLQEQSRIISRSLPLEPEPSENTTQLAIRFSDGTRVERRFLRSDKLEIVYNFVATKELLENKVLETHFPKVVFSNRNVTLQEAWLCPKATLFVSEQIV